ncbi:MAG: 5-carboxymethyl-2-hydroxymuconate isomerase, partial [Gammaproteobacteria bacterium]|nr:5-carboxymethyl-2-hydroxymuconate isomerase [Gammaproteobacteria bacterium]
MPHIILEYSREIIADDALPAILDRLEKSVADSGLFECANIKLRCIPVRYYRLGTGKNGFIHVQCRIHQGRSQEQR